jgi:hypothetical protein
MQVSEDIDLDLFLMANLSSRITGLPFVVWISPRGNAKHDVRVKVSSSPKAVPEEMVSVGLRPFVHVIDGTLPGKDLELLTQWIDLNRDTIIRYWDGDIAYTEDAMAALKAI